MTPEAQLLIALRILNTVPRFSARLTLFSASSNVALFCDGPSILFVESDDFSAERWFESRRMPEAQSLRAAGSEEEKVRIFQAAIKDPSILAAFREAMKDALCGFFAAPLVKSEMKARSFTTEAVL